jgi:phytoene/squalene synthetase
MSTQEGLANHMGLFLQKTNIIRDYLVGVSFLSRFRI